MPRTTLNLDPSVLAELKRRQRREGRSLGELASELLAVALAEGGTEEAAEEFSWVAHAMGARVDLEDRDAVVALLERDSG